MSFIGKTIQFTKLALVGFLTFHSLSLWALDSKPKPFSSKVKVIKKKALDPQEQVEARYKKEFEQMAASNKRSLSKGAIYYQQAKKKWQQDDFYKRLSIGNCPVDESKRNAGPLEKYLSLDKRQQRSGPTCQCLPFSDSCRPFTCLCSELCPDDYTILYSKADDMMPTAANSFSFTNTKDRLIKEDSVYNKTVFKNAKMSSGYCTGMAMLEKKFTTLAFFKPQYLPSLSKKLKDPFTGETIAPKNTQAYNQYILKQIRNVAQGKVGFFPGIENVAELTSSKYPLFQTEVGTMVAKSWAYYNYIDPYPPLETPSLYYSMEQTKLIDLIESLRQKLPRFDEQKDNLLAKLEADKSFLTAEEYENRKKELERHKWNEQGPWERTSIDFWSEIKRPSKKTKGKVIKQHYAHSLTVYAYQEDKEKGEFHLCARDPNHLAKHDSHCKNKFTFKKNAKGLWLAEYEKNEFGKIGKITIPFYDQAEKGNEIRQLQQACKKLKANVFFSNDCKSKGH